MSTNDVDKLWIFISQKTTSLRTNFMRATWIGKREITILEVNFNT